MYVMLWSKTTSRTLHGISGSASKLFHFCCVTGALGSPPLVQSGIALPTLTEYG